MSGWGAIYGDVTYALSAQTEQMTRLQEEAATGARVNRASDDPSSAYAILRLQQQQDRAASASKNLDAVETNLQTCDTALQSTSSALLQVQQLLSQASSGTYTSDQRASMAQEVNSLLEQVLTDANTQGAAGYVFGGGRTDSPPFVAQRDGSGQITSVQYQGASSAMQVPVADGVQQYGQLVGDNVFRASRRQTPLFLGTTGAAVGSGTSSARGDIWLTVAHTATSFDVGSQLAAGASSASGDTIVGAHKVTISAAQKTIQLDDGVATSFVGNETNLCLQNASGDKAYVDMSGWTTADGQFNLQANGTLSLDDGATTTPLTASANLGVADSRTGQVLFVDARAISRTGQEAVDVPGTHDLFGALVQIRDTLANTRSLTSDQQVQFLSQSIDSVREVMNQTTLSDTAVGGSLKALDDLKQSQSSLSATAKSQQSSLQDADITQVTVDLTRAQNLYQMTLASAAKLLNISLLNYLPIS